MTRHSLDLDDDRSGDAWIVGLLAGCGLIAMLVALVIATGPHSGLLASEIAEAELAIAHAAPDTAGSPGPVRVAAHK